MNFKPLIRNPRAFAESLSIKDAVAMARELDRLYHEDADSPVPDEVYDVLRKVIEERSPNNSYLKKVGSKVGSGVKVKLKTPMPSLDKRFPGTKELTRFLVPGTYVLSHKLDGNSIVIGYVDGLPAYVYTRGDGLTGQNVSGILPSLYIPKKIGNRTLEVRAELIMSDTTFNSKFRGVDIGGRTYKVARNMVAGLTKRNVADKFVKACDVAAFEILNGYGSDKPLSHQLAQLKKWGFGVAPFEVVKNPTEQYLLDKYREWKPDGGYGKPYAIDGVVVTRDISYKRSASNPKHSVAFKVNTIDDAVTTKVTKVEWIQSRHNKLVPTIHIEPVVIGGATLSKITGHNFYFIQHGFRYYDRDKGLPVRLIGPGAEVRILRRGDVIPHVEDVVRPVRRPCLPDVAYKLGKNEVEAYAEDTSVSNERRILHFFSTLDVEGIKLGTIRKLEAVGLNTVSRILKASSASFMQAEGIQHATAVKLYQNIKKLRTEGAGFAKLGHASGAFGNKIGEGKLQFCIDTYPKLMSWVDVKSTAYIENKLSAVNGIDAQAAIIAKRLPRFARFLARTGIPIKEKTVTKVGSKLTDQAVLFTSVRDKELAEYVLANGGKVATTVKQATMLIIKEGASNTKIDEAKELGKPVYTIAAFKKKFGA